MTTKRLKVGVLVDLERRTTAGGHVKCWERLAKAAVRRDDLDLTVHVQNAKEGVDELSPFVRFVSHKPVFSTERLSWLLGNIPDHTDLSPWHPAIARALPQYDVVHTTDAFFAMAKTALAVCRRQGIPLVNSVHTDTPGYTKLYTRRTIERAFGNSFLSHLLLDRLRADLWQEKRMMSKLIRHHDQSQFALDTDPAALESMRRRMGGDRVGRLRRGIEKDLFTPKLRDRAWLEARFGIPADRIVILFVGRVNAGKNVMPAARAVAELIRRGRNVHFLVAGVGEEIPVIRDMLKDRASLPGSVPVAEMGRLYASADLFAFPSMLEVLANVVMEALSSGLPVLVNEGSGLDHLFVNGESGLVVGGNDWAGALDGLVLDEARRLALGRNARIHAERNLPSWDDVLAQDILPYWRRAAGMK